MPPSERPPRVFISYSRDSAEHVERVVELADRLRDDGIDAEVDEYNDPPPEGWRRWMWRQTGSSRCAATSGPTPRAWCRPCATLPLRLLVSTRLAPPPGMPAKTMQHAVGVAG